MGSIKINVKMTLQDIRSFSFAIAYQRVSWKIFRIMTLVIISLYIASAIVLNLVLPAEEFPGSLTLPVLVSVGLILMNILPFIIVYSAQKNNFNKSKLLQEMQTYEINGEGVIVTSPHSNFAFEWNDIFRVQEFLTGFLVNISPGRYLFIPRRCFESPVQF